MTYADLVRLVIEQAREQGMTLDQFLSETEAGRNIEAAFREHA